jgi:hypothetical protein
MAVAKEAAGLELQPWRKRKRLGLPVISFVIPLSLATRIPPSSLSINALIRLLGSSSG